MVLKKRERDDSIFGTLDNRRLDKGKKLPSEISRPFFILQPFQQTNMPATPHRTPRSSAS